jgi:hypothetical protein
MANEVLLNELITTWQEHTVEVEVPSLDEIHQSVKKFQRTVRLWNAFYYAMGAISIVAYGRLLFASPSLFTGVGSVLIIAGALCGTYQIHKGRSARPVPTDLGSTYIHFHRRELQRQRIFILKSWRYLLLPLPGVIVLMFAWRLPNALLANGQFVVLFALLIFGVIGARRRQARKLQREIDALDAAEKHH